MLGLELKTEVFCLFRVLLQTEFNFMKSKEDNPIRPQKQLEVFRIAQGLPLPLLDLLYGDQDEDIILSNFYRQWSTPTLIWNDLMFKEALINIVEYNTILISLNK